MSDKELQKFVKNKWKEANKARKESSKMGNFRNELYWQGKESGFMEVLKYIEDNKT